MLIRSEAFNQGYIYKNEGTWGTRLFQCYFGLRGWQLIRDIPYFGRRTKETCTCHWPFFSILRTDYPYLNELEKTFVVHLVMRLKLGTLRSNEADGNENVKKEIAGFKQSNNFARASRFLVHFFGRFCTTKT